MRLFCRMIRAFEDVVFMVDGSGYVGNNGGMVHK